MIPDIGQFRFLVTLYQPSQDLDANGQAEYSFVQRGIWACHAKSVRGRFNDDGEQEVAGRRTYRFILRDGSGIDYGWEIVYDGRRYRPDRIDNWDERNRYQIVYAVEVDL